LHLFAFVPAGLFTTLFLIRHFAFFSRFAWLPDPDQTLFNGHANELRSIGDSQFFHETGPMRFNGSGGNSQAIGDFPIGIPGPD
jgi:hypothetical protein